MPKFASAIDLTKNELQNARVQNLASAPGSPVEGQIYWNTGDEKLYIWDGAAWVDATSQGVTYSPGSGISISGSTISADFGTGAGKVTQGNDARLSDQRVPTDNSVTSAKIVDGAIVNADINASAAIALSKLATDPLARGNHTGTQLHTTISDFDTGVQTNRLDQMAAPTSAVSAGSQKITNLGNGTNSGDAVNLGQLQAAQQGIKAKQSVRVATTGNITISTALNSGDSIDGVTLANGDRVLVKDQSSAAQNGIYVVAASPSRSEDADVWDELVGALVVVEEGSTHGDTLWLCTADRGGTLGTDPVEWSALPSLTDLIAGDGLDKTGNEVSVDSTVARRNADNTITGRVHATASGGGIVIDGTTTTGLGVRGRATGTGVGLEGESATGTAVQASSTSGRAVSAQSGSNTALEVKALSGSAPSIDVFQGGTGPALRIGASHGSGPVFDGANKGAIVNISDGVNDDDAATVGQIPKSYTANIGNGSSTSIAVTHNLGTRDVRVEVYRNGSPYDTVFCDVERTSTSAVTLGFGTAPSSNEYRVLVTAV